MVVAVRALLAGVARRRAAAVQWCVAVRGDVGTWRGGMPRVDALRDRRRLHKGGLSAQC